MDHREIRLACYGMRCVVSSTYLDLKNLITNSIIHWSRSYLAIGEKRLSVYELSSGYRGMPFPPLTRGYRAVAFSGFMIFQEIYDNFRAAAP